jgi:hypothetical protein
MAEYLDLMMDSERDVSLEAELKLAKDNKYTWRTLRLMKAIGLQGGDWQQFTLCQDPADLTQYTRDKANLPPLLEEKQETEETEEEVVVDDPASESEETRVSLKRKHREVAQEVEEVDEVHKKAKN